ncbi:MULTISPECIES: cysteine desulfurase family protein [Limosilactobacillus]|uniref:cysteine desulfurase family protein n=1 Tax=Limosilactobacillus TaxID=2742598 RepID=UPI0024B8FFAA|nr:MULTISPECIES: cysteine desulfurase family protein [Limosilactobacillus]MDM8219299.1 cysteine desulfurase family protein [Limosilactobacillus mucosae]MDM8314071.1 cysteine desulfurase family protein [Limosilactobacillus mucosae]
MGAKILDKRVYIDNAGTTPMAPEVVSEMTDKMTNVFGNASTTNYYGRIAKQVLEDSRHVMAESINAAYDDEIVITSGGTESDNTAIKQTALARQNEGHHIITTRFEHEAILRPLEDLEKQGYEVTYLNVDENGQIDLEELKQAIRPDTILVSVMMVNNEVGSHLPIHEIGEIVAPTNAWFHTDAVQAYGTVPIDVQKDQIDLLSVSGHKLNGPKMIGFLYRRRGINFPSFVRGGDQELKRRAGTENVPAAAGFAKAIELHMADLADQTKRYLKLKQRLVDGLKANNIEFEINGRLNEGMAPQVISIWFKDVPNDALLTNLDLDGIVGAAGSACTSGSLDPSHVLVAMYGKDSPRVWETLRFSFGIYNTTEDVDRLLAALNKYVPRLKNNGDRGQR